MSSRHTTPLRGWGVRKVNQPAMSARFPAGEKFPLCLSLHQRALRPEIGANLSFISWLKLFRPEGIDMQTGWFSCRSAERAFIQKALAPFMIHVCVAYTMTPLSMVHVSVWLHWGCIGFKYAWIRPKTGYRDGWANVTPSDLYTPSESNWWPLAEEVKCPHSSSRGMAALGLTTSLPACLQGTAQVQSSMEQLEDRGMFSESAALTRQLHSIPQSWLETLMQIHS